MLIFHVEQAAPSTEGELGTAHPQLQLNPLRMLYHAVQALVTVTAMESSSRGCAVLGSFSPPFTAHMQL